MLLTVHGGVGVRSPRKKGVGWCRISRKKRYVTLEWPELIIRAYRHEMKLNITRKCN